MTSAPKPADGSPGENRERMDVAFVQNSEHDINHQDRDDQQDPQVSERTLEGFGGALKVRRDTGWQCLAGEILHLRNHVAQRRARLQVERNRHRVELSVMIDGLRPGSLLQLGERVERNQRTI